MNSSYITSAQQAEQLPALDGLPEVAFVGRSNCGKSTLLNALLGRNNLARTSNTPGRTQMVNFFSVEMGEKKMVLADLPGYGFAAAGREVKVHWTKLIDAYLRRPQMTGVLFLMDIRRSDPLQEDDLSLLNVLSSRRPPADLTVVLTKADKLNQSDTAKAKAKLAEALKAEGINVTRITVVSSLKKKGIDELKKEILAPVLD